ncbi:MAG: Lrp/AsnC family transcriptional regulator [Dehalococcoidia bacterium]|nr:Lrp/AsnC family transcriptional regulator [Dehalococcoidia bacterium]
MTTDERRVLLAIQDGLPIVPEPYAEVGAHLGLDEERVREIIGGLLAARRIKRIGAIPNHYALGITANGMSVWNIPDDDVEEVGRQLAERPEVSHSYRRPRAHDWPYNVFAMVHGTDREKVAATVEEIGCELGISDRPHEILFSARILKKRGTRLKAG